MASIIPNYPLVELILTEDNMQDITEMECPECQGPTEEALVRIALDNFIKVFACSSCLVMWRGMISSNIHGAKECQ